MILSDLMTSNVLTLLAYEPNAFRFYASSSFLSARLISCEENVPPTHPPPKLLKLNFSLRVPPASDASTVTVQLSLDQI